MTDKPTLPPNETVSYKRVEVTKGRSLTKGSRSPHERARTRRRRALYAAAGIHPQSDTPETASAPRRAPKRAPPAPITHPDASEPLTEPHSGSPKRVIGRYEPERPPRPSTALAAQLDALVAALPPDTVTDQLIAAYLTGAAEAHGVASTRCISYCTAEQRNASLEPALDKTSC